MAPSPHVIPTLVVAGVRDPLIKIANAPSLAVLPHVDAVRVPGAHALDYSDPQLIAEPPSMVFGRCAESFQTLTALRTG